MAVTHPTAVRNILADAFDAYVNTGAGTAQLIVKDGATTVVAFDLPNPAFGAASGGVLTMNGTPNTENAIADGPSIDSFQIVNRDGTLAASGSITGPGGGGDIEASNTNVADLQECELTSLTYAAAP